MTDPKPPNVDPSSNEEDRELVSFLKTNRAPTPVPPPEAEAQLMQAITNSKQTPPITSKRTWIIAAIAITSSVLWGIWWMVGPKNSTVFAQKERELEAFLVETWQGVSSSEEDIDELDWLPPQAPISQIDPFTESFAYQPQYQESHP